MAKSPGQQESMRGSSPILIPGLLPEMKLAFVREKERATVLAPAESNVCVGCDETEKPVTKLGCAVCVEDMRSHSALKSWWRALV